MKDLKELCVRFDIDGIEKKEIISKLETKFRNVNLILLDCSKPSRCEHCFHNNCLLSNAR